MGPFYAPIFDRGVGLICAPITKRMPLAVPTLMIWGERDTALGKELTIDTDKLVRDFTLRYVPDVSHWVQQEAPETVNAMIEAWLTGQPVPQVGRGGKLLADAIG